MKFTNERPLADPDQAARARTLAAVMLIGFLPPRRTVL